MKPGWLVRVVAIAAVMSLAGCGDLPEPFMGYPGATARRLAKPPPSRLDVPLPEDSLLANDAASSWASATAAALVEQSVPAYAAPAVATDWRLVLSASLQGQSVVPRYVLENPKGEAKGSTEGPAVPASDWARGDVAALKVAADAVAPKIEALLEEIDAAARQSDPNSLLNRPARLYLTGVTGAPGDGDNALAMAVRRKLPDGGDVVQDAAGGADFSVAGLVNVVDEGNGQQRVEVQWVVDDAYGNEMGRVVQLNEVPAHSLDAFWGDVALAVAVNAASGVHEVVNNASRRHRKPDPGTAPAKS